MAQFTIMPQLNLRAHPDVALGPGLTIGLELRDGDETYALRIGFEEVLSFADADESALLFIGLEYALGTRSGADAGHVQRGVAPEPLRAPRQSGALPEAAPEALEPVDIPNASGP